MADKYAVFGNPVGHSKSPQIHAAFAAETGEPVAYGAVEPPVDGFAATLGTFVASGARGCNVTAPFKLDAFNAATRREPAAEMVGASNCLKFEDGEIIAENFDGVGLRIDIERNMGFPMTGKRVLVLGAGGASRGVLHPFLDAGPASLTIANRTASKAEALAALVSGRGNVTGCGFADLDGQAFDILVNGTSASQSAAGLPLSDGVFAPGALAYDMVYGRGLTPFLRQARAAGVARIADGVGMLVEQAAESFQWWRGVRPSTAPVIADLTVPLDG